MKIKKQNGVVVLIMTSLLILAALILSLGIYKSTFYQIKRAQNEVLAKQGHWRAEGAIECLLSNLMTKNTSPILTSTPKECDTYTQPIDSFKVELNDKIYTAEATSSNQTIQKSFIANSSIGNGSIQTVGDLKFIGTVAIRPDALNEKVSGNSYKCVSVAFSNRIIFQHNSTHGSSSRTNGLEVSDPIASGPFEGFNGDCHSDYKTIIPKKTAGSNTIEIINAHDILPGKSNPLPFKNDFVPDLNLDPFYNLFNLPKNTGNILKVSKNTEEFVYKKITSATNCSQEISNHFIGTNKNKGLWLYGHCYINSPLDLQSNDSQILVIQDGAFALFGAMNFKGTTYHLVDMTNSVIASNISNYWHNSHGSNTPTALSEFVEPTTTSIMFYSSAPKGGVIYDVNDGISTIVGDISLEFHGESNPYFQDGKYQWKKGSWNDL
ncbi:hypothetical protein [Aliivibrio salmonicida]|uniref:hypothetical protein n=1 Tax=Aliivibrio salmonicida TaxID=40269 RepID=UPI003D0AD081